MLILTRRVGETLMIGDDVTVTVLGVKGHQVRIGINAPKHLAVHREEIYNRIKKENTLNIGKDFSTEPSGRHMKDGKNSGESLRENFLIPMMNNLKKNEKLTIILDDGVNYYSSAFLDEAFTRLVEICGCDPLDKLEFKYENPDFEFYKNSIILNMKLASKQKKLNIYDKGPSYRVHL